MSTVAAPRLQSIGISPADYQDALPMGSSVVLQNQSGRFLTAASGNYALTTGSDTQIDAWTDTCYSVTHDGTQGTSPFTSSSTAGKTVLPGTRAVHNDGCYFWLPAKSGTTLLASNIGLKCDLNVTSNVQTVDNGTTTTKMVQIVNVDLANNWALVKAII